jgi:hypothetical protein
VEKRQVEPKDAYVKAVDKQGFANLLRQGNWDTSFLDLDGDTPPGKGAAARPAMRR